MRWERLSPVIHAELRRYPPGLQRAALAGAIAHTVFLVAAPMLEQRLRTVVDASLLQLEHSQDRPRARAMIWNRLAYVFWRRYLQPKVGSPPFGWLDDLVNFYDLVAAMERQVEAELRTPSAQRLPDYVP
jgi:hypothetical protein